jgi:hypothetical protein
MEFGIDTGSHRSKKDQKNKYNNYCKDYAERMRYIACRKRIEEWQLHKPVSPGHKRIRWYHPEHDVCG